METTETWIEAGDYGLRLDGEVIVVRNAKGRVLKTIPSKAKKTPEFEKLEALRMYLHQHSVRCGDTVREWFLKGLPIPMTLVIAVWPDPAWQSQLKDLVVSTDGGITGFLRNATADGLQIVDLDGETVSVPINEDALVLIPHPAIMEDLDDWREFAVELGINQGLDQLFRDIHIKPSDADGITEAISKYDGAQYERGGTLIGRSRGAGFTASLYAVSLVVMEEGVETTIELSVSGWDPSEEAELGRVYFTRDGSMLSPENVGPIAWSEGIRMCEFVYAGRTIENNQQ